MSLSEVSETHIRKNGVRSARPAQGIMDDSTSPSAAAAGVTASAVQSMLKTTTETGDIGLFSVRSSHLPLSGSRTLRHRSESFESSNNDKSTQRSVSRSSHRSRPPPPPPSFTSVARHDTVSSNHNSYRCGYQTRRPRQYSGKADGPFGPSHGPPGLYNQRSTTTLRSHDGTSSPGAQSPHVYPTRLPRPGRRTISPAISETQWPTHYPEAPYKRAASVGTASPSSMSHRQRRPYPTGYIQDFNRSVPSFAGFPAPTLPPGYPGIRPSPFSSRTVTPVSLRLPSPPVGPPSRFQTPVGLQRSSSALSTPHYYNYSESFVEEDASIYGQESSMVSLPFNIGQTIHEHEPTPVSREARTPFGTVPGSVFIPSELPTSANRLSLDRTAEAPTTELPSNNAARQVAPSLKQMDKQESSTLPPPNEISTAPEPVENTKVELAKSASPQKETHGANVGLIDTKGFTGLDSEAAARNETDATEAPRPASRVHATSPPTSFFHNSNRFSRDHRIVDSPAIVPPNQETEAPAQDETQPVSSDDVLPMPRLPKTLSKSASLGTERASGVPGWQLPSLQFRPLSFSNLSQLAIDRPRSSGGIVRSEPSGILSPTPERPMSSQSNRERFSKILGIGHNSATGKSAFDGNSRSRRSSQSSPQPAPGLSVKERSYRSAFAPIRERDSTGESFSGRFSHQSNDVRSSMTTNHDRSTVESLLDKHIESLGLNPGPHHLPDRPREEEQAQELTEPSVDTLSGDEKTATLSRLLGERKWKGQVRSATITSKGENSLTSTEREALMPAKLFNTSDMAPVRTSSTSNIIPPKDRGKEGPSLSWLTLDSSSSLLDLAALGKPLLGDSTIRGDTSDCNANDAHNVDFPSNERQNEIVPKRSTYSWDGQTASIPDAGHRTVEKQPSGKSKMKLRLRGKGRPSIDQRGSAPVTADGIAGTDESHLRQAVSMDTERVPPLLSPRIRIPRKSLGDRPSSLNHFELFAPLPRPPVPVKPNSAIRNKPSVRTVGSHKSIASPSEPLNTSRPSMERPQLPAPDLGPRLTQSTMSLNLNPPPRTSSIRPALRQTQSFFSDDSSHVARMKHGSVRKGLQKVRSHITFASPKSQSLEIARNKIATVSQLCNATGPPMDKHDGTTIGMSDFAYKKRQLLERLKDWWKRHTSQKAVKLRKKKSKRLMAGIEPYDGV